MESKTEQLVVSFLLADYECVGALPKNSEFVPQVGICEEITCNVYFSCG